MQNYYNKSNHNSVWKCGSNRTERSNGCSNISKYPRLNSNLRIAGFQVFSVAKIAIVCLVCFSSDLRGFALHKSRRGRPQLLDPRPWCVWQTLATARSPKLTTPRPTRKLISRQERTQYLPLMQGSLNTEPASRFCRNLEDSAQGLRREPSSPSPGGAGERVQLAPNCNGSSRANGLALLRWQGSRRRSQ